MKCLMILTTILFLATSSFAAEISETEVRTFLDGWLAAQNSSSYANYATMYADSFTGIRRSGSNTHNLNREAWLKDRKKMFKKKMVVEAANPEVQLAGTTASVKFEQTWASGTYKDKGDKLLNLTLESGKLKITREEMLFSKPLSLVTSLKEKDCKKVSKKLSAIFDNRELERSECIAPKGWQLFTVVGGERYWLEIVLGNSVWSTEEEVIIKGEYRFGNFQSIDFEKAEWGITSTGEPKFLIFPVVAQDTDVTDNNLNRFFVVKIMDKVPHFCGVTKTITEARDIAEKTSTCINKLSQRTIQLKLSK